MPVYVRYFTDAITDNWHQITQVYETQALANSDSSGDTTAYTGSVGDEVEPFLYYINATNGSTTATRPAVEAETIANWRNERYADLRLRLVGAQWGLLALKDNPRAANSRLAIVKIVAAIQQDANHGNATIRTALEAASQDPWHEWIHHWTDANWPAAYFTGADRSVSRMNDSYGQILISATGVPAAGGNYDWTKVDLEVAVFG